MLIRKMYMKLRIPKTCVFIVDLPRMIYNIAFFLFIKPGADLGGA